MVFPLRREGDDEGSMADVVGMAGGAIPLNPEPTDLTSTAFKARKLRIVMIGAGISGIQLAKDVSTKMKPGSYELEIYEKNAELGGTWYENTYPGCACDVPAHTYQFSWAPNPNWSKFYAPAPEIRAYLNDVVEQHDLKKYMSFSHRALHASWDEGSSKWTIKLEANAADGKPHVIERQCDVFVQGVGTLNNWKYPDIPHLLDFKGKLMHTATWDDNFDMSGKTVAVIGNGASAVQVVAALQPAVGKLENYMRTASWMLPHLFSGGDVQKDYPEEFKNRLRDDPRFYLQYRTDLEKTLAGGFEALWRGTPALKKITEITTEHMKKHIKDPEILAAMMPNFELGCRRFTPGDHYLHALAQDNVKLIWEHIDHVTESEIVLKNGTKRQVDVIVCASGFETSYEPRFPIVGRDGYSLADNWGRDKECESYMGATVARFPNFFTFMPPICPVIGSAVPGIQATSNYIMRVIDRIQHDSLKSVMVKERAQKEFNEWAQSQFPTMVFTGSCHSWYKNSKGKVFIPWPGTMLHYIKTTEMIRWEDFDFVFENPEQKYASLGNGITKEGVAPEVPPWLMNG